MINIQTNEVKMHFAGAIRQVEHGQEFLITSNPSAGFSVISFPLSSRIAGSIPKKGVVADPGFRFVTAGSGEINIPPVSVCHQVSTIGHLSSPTTL